MNEEMNLEKQSSKRNFLQLFDWNAKSRKKLFSNKSESSPEKSKQGEEYVNSSTFSRLQEVQINGGYDPGTNVEKCSSGDTMYVTKAPGVVARLMGLDSLPTTSDTVEPSFTSESFRDNTHYSNGFQANVVMYDGMRNKLDGFSKNPVEVMLHKAHDRPIEKFQSEVLPPKSAKPISITHHRLLSPIKGPGFVRTMDADCLMEAASKMMARSPRSMMTHNKLPSLGSPTVPLRIQDIKEKVEAAEKSRRIFRTSLKGKEQDFTHYERAQGLVLLRASGKPKNSKYEDSRTTKSASFSFQAKPKVEKIDDPGSVNTPVSVNQWKPSEVKHSRNIERKHKNAEIKSRNIKQSDVLRQNDQRQNSDRKEERDSLRRPLPNEKERKSSSSNGFSRPHKTVNKIVVSNDYSRKEHASSTTRINSRKKEFPRKNRVSDEGSVATLIRDERSDNFNYDKSNLWESAAGKNGTDVVSFTFNSPIKKTSTESTSSGKSPESKRSSFLIPDSNDEQSTPLGPDVATGDALSILLEQKLKELASRVEASQKDLIYSEFLCGSADSSRVSGTTVHMTNSSMLTKSNSQLGSHEDKAGVSFRYDCSSSTSLSESWLDSMPKCQESSEECSRTVASNSEGSCNSWDANKALDITGWSSQGVDREQLLDSASSIMSLGVGTSTSSNWELDYIRFILSNASLELEDFVLQKTRLISTDLFDTMEEDGNWWWSNQNVGGDDDHLKHSRKALFDCVGESLEQRCLLLINKGRNQWMKLRSMLFGQKMDQLSREMYIEISGWKRMEDLMVDQLVDNDMSSRLGRWVDFETEAFEQGVEIEKGILASLIDELISDFLL